VDEVGRSARRRAATQAHLWTTHDALSCCNYKYTSNALQPRTAAQQPPSLTMKLSSVVCCLRRDVRAACVHVVCCRDGRSPTSARCLPGHAPACCLCYSNSQLNAHWLLLLVAPQTVTDFLSIIGNYVTLSVCLYKTKSRNIWCTGTLLSWTSASFT